MGKVTLDMSMSLDGFIAGPNDDIEQPLSEGGDRLHEWVYGLASWRELHGFEGGKTDRDRMARRAGQSLQRRQLT